MLSATRDRGHSTSTRAHQLALFAGSRGAGGSGTTWSHASDLLIVDLDRAYTTGETVSVSVTYSGDPAGDAFGWDTVGGDDMIWTLSELEARAIDAALRSTYEPATQAGEAVRAWVTERFLFEP